MKNLKNSWFYSISFIFYVFLIFVFSILSFIFIEQNATNTLIALSSSVKNKFSQDIIEIVVDDQSDQIYKTPWSRDMYAEIFDYLDKYSKPKVIGFDLIALFEKTPQQKDKKLLQKFSQMDNLVVAIEPEVKEENQSEEFMRDFANEYALDVELKTKFYPSIYEGFVISDSNFKIPVKNYGSVLVVPKATSSTVTDATPIVLAAGAYYPSLPFKMYLIANNTNKVVIDDKFVYVPKTGLKLPYTYNNGTFDVMLRYYDFLPNAEGKASTYSHYSISAHRIISTYRALEKGITPKTHPELYSGANPKYVNPEFFNNQVVFIGVNLSGPTKDALKTPLNDRHPGVDIHATAYDNYVHNISLHYVSGWYAILTFVLLLLISYLVIIKTKFLKGLFTLFLIDVIFTIAAFAAATNGVIVFFAAPLVCQFVTIVFGYSFKFIAENRNKEKIKSAMGKYLSKDIMQNVVKNIDDLKLGGKRAVVTVLFSDIRGFTSLSEKMSAEEVSSILNEYFAEMEPIISKYNGVINKFIGDAIMALFGEPITDENHPQNAVKCAYEMLQRVKYLREKWLKEGKPKIEIGVGINTGEVFIGNIGTETRMEYTVIGDTVNLASRIESYNKVYKTNLLVSSSTYPYIADISDVIKIKDVQIRGKAKKMDIYEILRINID